MGRYRYRVSGLGLSSEEPLDGLGCWRGPLTRPWRLTARPAIPFPPRSRRVRLLRRQDHSLLLAWPRRGCFWINPQTRRVVCRQAPEASREAFLDILLGPMVSLLLSLDGEDPLHGCAIRMGEEALCFVGQPGAGKSTLAAAFLLSGHGLIADDLLTIRWQGRRAMCQPGHPEIRLWPASGRRLLPGFSRLPLVVPTASKRRLDPRACAGGFTEQAVAVRVFYELRRCAAISRPRIEPLQAREAWLALVRNLYDVSLVSPESLARQFDHLGKLAARVPVRRLLLPRTPGDPLRLPAVVGRDLR